MQNQRNPYKAYVHNISDNEMNYILLITEKNRSYYMEELESDINSLNNIKNLIIKRGSDLR